MGNKYDRRKIIRSVLPREIDKANLVQCLKDSWATYDKMQSGLRHNDDK